MLAWVLALCLVPCAPVPLVPRRYPTQLRFGLVKLRTRVVLNQLDEIDKVEYPSSLSLPHLDRVWFLTDNTLVVVNYNIAGLLGFQQDS